MDDERFLQQFESAVWPLAGWHHREHVKVACSRERFMSSEAKARFLEPDLTPLPQSRKSK